MDTVLLLGFGAAGLLILLGLSIAVGGSYERDTGFRVRDDGGRLIGKITKRIVERPNPRMGGMVFLAGIAVAAATGLVWLAALLLQSLGLVTWSPDVEPSASADLRTTTDAAPVPAGAHRSLWRVLGFRVVTGPGWQLRMPPGSEQREPPLETWIATLRGPSVGTDAGMRASLSVLVGRHAQADLDVDSYVESFRSRIEESGLRVVDNAPTTVAGRPARRLFARQEVAGSRFQLLVLAADDGVSGYEVRCGAPEAVFARVRRACVRVLRSFTLTDVVLASPPPGEATDADDAEDEVDDPVEPGADRSVPSGPTTAQAATSPSEGDSDVPSRGEIATAIGRAAPAVRACSAGAGGVATVRITVAGETGRVTGAAVVGDFGTAVTSCIERVVRTQVQTRPFARPTLTVTFPFRLPGASRGDDGDSTTNR